MIGIIGAMEEEAVLIREWMEDVQIEPHSGFEFVLGQLDGKAVVLLRCGIGKVAAGVGCGLLIDRYRPCLVINTGSAGGIDSSLKIGDAVIASSLLYHDVDVTAFGYALGQLPAQNPTFPVDEKLIRAGEEAVRQLLAEGELPQGFKSTRGLISSSDTFMSDENKIAALRALFPDVTAVEMEGAAIAHVSTIMKTPYLVIRSLSDVAGTDSPVKFDEFLPIAAKHSARIVRRIVRNLE